MSSAANEDEPRQDDFSWQRAQARVGGFVAGRWRLERVLGVGGMGAVFEARHRNGKRVAIKILHPELALDEITLKRFLREGYLANAVEHPGVVSVLDDGMTDDGLPFLVMDFLEGESLDGRLQRLGRPLSVADVLSVAVAMLEVLSEAHRKGVVHRDLKPDNVFLCADGSVKILDFGIARLLDGVAPQAVATQAGIALGTPTFMAPEQAEARMPADGRSDLWAVGATVFYALTGYYLHEAQSVAEFLTKLVTTDPKPLRELSPGVPEPIAAVIEGALKRNPKRRWQEAEAMRAALLEAAQQAGLVVPERPSPEGFVPPVSSRRWMPSFPDDPPLSLQRPSSAGQRGEPRPVTSHWSDAPPSGRPQSNPPASRLPSSSPGRHGLDPAEAQGRAKPTLSGLGPRSSPPPGMQAPAASLPETLRPPAPSSQPGLSSPPVVRPVSWPAPALGPAPASRPPPASKPASASWPAPAPGAAPGASVAQPDGLARQDAPFSQRPITLSTPAPPLPARLRGKAWGGVVLLVLGLVVAVKFGARRGAVEPAAAPSGALSVASAPDAAASGPAAALAPASVQAPAASTPAAASASGAASVAPTSGGSSKGPPGKRPGTTKKGPARDNTDLGVSRFL